MKLIRGTILIIIILFAGLLSSVNAQNTSNKGTDFWVGFGNHVGDWQTAGGTQKMSLYVTSDVNTNVTVEIAGLLNQSYPVTANGITTIDIPDGAKLPREGKYATGIHLTAEKPVVVYSHIFASAVSGATLVLPTSTLGKDYYSINYTQISNQVNSYSYFFVVAVEDNTQVEIIPSGTTTGSWAAGSINLVTLQKGEIYQVLGTLSSNSGNNIAGVDLTGSRIRSISTTSEDCKRIAVFSGSGKISIGCTPGAPGSADNLYQQVYPTLSWGKKFITAPLKSRNYDVFRILKSDPNAIVTLNGSVIPPGSFVNNLYFDFSSQEVNVIESNKPVQTVQYAVTQNKSINCVNLSEPTGDPEMIFLNPVEQNIDNITLYSTNEFNILTHFINIVIETSAVNSFQLDGANKSSAFSIVPNDPNYSFAQLTVTQGVHNLQASKGFNAIAYGFGVAESYGYSAGTNVKSLAIEARKKVSNQIVENGCVNEALNFSIKLRYQTDRLLWDLGNGIQSKEILNPQPLNSNPPDGLFEYQFPDPVIYSLAKDYTIKVTANRASSDGCGSTEIIESQFTIFNPPLSTFEFTAGICQGAAVQFTDKSDGQGRNIKSWLWDFGDGSNDPVEKVKQNPSHIYADGGTYQVTLTIANESNCGPVTSVAQSVIITKKPLANFSFSTPACNTKAITFKDSSTSAEGKIIKWIWDPGDGTLPLEYDSAKDFVHTYTTTGTFQVSLKVLSDKGCESSLMINAVLVLPVPLVNFVVPEVCIKDVFAQFTDSSFIADGSGLSYLWDFGDPQSGVINNSSTLKDPLHRYNLAGDYFVSLTVRSQQGCETKVIKAFTVNGAIPKAAFELLNSAALCSNKEVIFRNTSTVDFGEIGKVEWYFDYENAPAIKVVDQSPSAGKQYRFQYPVFSSPVSKTFKVRMLAYSGGVCFDEEIQSITVLASPEVIFTAMPDVCQEVPAFQITQAKEKNNQAGNGAYYGAGVSLNGIFNPAQAGIGTHTLKYVFTAINGCADSLSRDIIVMPTPFVNAGRDTLILEGGETKLNATATGSDLVYKWTPSLGLSRDDIPDPVASPVNDVTYTLTVTSDQACVSMDNIFIKVLKQPEVPNAFTPNGDGVNDLWNIKYLESYVNASVQVFNRYGEIVYNSAKGYSSPWNGQMNGTNLPLGTYYYIIQPRTPGRQAMSGSVTIIR